MMTAMKKHLAELNYPAPRTVSKLVDQVSYGSIGSTLIAYVVAFRSSYFKKWHGALPTSSAISLDVTSEGSDRAFRVKYQC